VSCRIENGSRHVAPAFVALDCGGLPRDLLASELFVAGNLHISKSTPYVKRKRYGLEPIVNEARRR
jgi:transcriptional regulator of aromatic amino acid metabolism